MTGFSLDDLLNKKFEQLQRAKEQHSLNKITNPLSALNQFSRTTQPTQPTNLNDTTIKIDTKIDTKDISETLSNAIESPLSSPLLSLSPDQQSAVDSIMTHPINLLTGAAGTGKTFTSKVILTELLKEYPLQSIFITAFTGKAVLNLINNFKTDEYLNGLSSQSMTIHKFLQFKPIFKEVLNPTTNLFEKKRYFEPEFNSVNKRLDCKVLIIDECSMVGNELMSQLISALDYNSLSKLILIGDINQLQPVIGRTSIANFIQVVDQETGLLVENPINIATLSTIHRQKSNEDGTENDIVYVADLIKKGDLTTLKQVATTNCMTINGIQTPLNNVKFVRTENYADLYKVIDIISVKKEFNYNTNEDVVITQTNVNTTGQEILNQRLNKYLKIDKELINCGVDIKLLGVGDNILFTKNNYEQGYINGTFGKVLSIEINEEGIMNNALAHQSSKALPNKTTQSATQTFNPFDSNQTSTTSTKGSTNDYTVDYTVEYIPDSDIDLSDDDHLINVDKESLEKKSLFEREASHSITVSFTDIYGTYKELTLKSIGDISSVILANAITCYKAQGSTYERVIVNLCDCKSGNTINNEYAYTAVTRASKYVWILYNDTGLAKIKSRQLKGVTTQEKLQTLTELSASEDSLPPQLRTNQGSLKEQQSIISVFISKLLSLTNRKDNQYE